MKLYPLMLLLFFVYTAQAQGRHGSRTSQIEQLQQLKQTIARKIDTLHLQLMQQETSIEGIHKKLDQLKRENNNKDKPDIASKEQASKRSLELINTANLASNLQKKIDQRLVALDKAVDLQQDLEDKISALERENNQ
ncbi:MAG: hypothetical protein NVSMB7_10070 [Chitinophagaceae bacterium]